MSKYIITMRITASAIIHQISGSQGELREILEKLAREELAVFWCGEEMMVANIDITDIVGPILALERNENE